MKPMSLVLGIVAFTIASVGTEAGSPLDRARLRVSDFHAVSGAPSTWCGTLVRTLIDEIRPRKLTGVR